MINFEDELKRFSPIPGVNQAEEAIYKNDLRDLSDIVTQMAEEIRSSEAQSANQIIGRVRR